MIWIALICVLAMLVAAIAVVMLRSLMAAVIAASVIEFTLAFIFVILHAPDVAMTEAVVGAGFSGVLLALTLKKLNILGETDDENV